LILGVVFLSAIM